jgi:hypothetical protein
MKTFNFSYVSSVNDEDDGLPYPLQSHLTAAHSFADGTTWDVILYEFCKFLESSGYVGVTNKVKLDDRFGIMASHHLFDSVEYKDEDTE